MVFSFTLLVLHQIKKTNMILRYIIFDPVGLLDRVIWGYKGSERLYMSSIWVQSSCVVLTGSHSDNTHGTIPLSYGNGASVILLLSASP